MVQREWGGVHGDGGGGEGGEVHQGGGSAWWAKASFLAHSCCF